MERATLYTPATTNTSNSNSIEPSNLNSKDP